MQFACPGLLASLEGGATVVTPTPLLARVATHTFDRHLSNQGAQSWTRRNVYPIRAWLNALWQNVRYSGADVAALLSPAQEQALWRRIIEQHTPGLFDTETTAALADRAASLIAEWCLPLEDDAWADHEDGQHFLAWLRSFCEICDRNAWISSTDLWRLLPKWVDAGYCGNEAIVFAGFSNTTPALSRLFEVLGKQASVLNVGGRASAQPIPVRRCGELAEEIETAARWARAVIEHQPQSSIGIFVPDLATNRRLVERIFQQICYPAEAVLRVRQNDAPDRESVFHLHTAGSLREQPVIAGALLFLRLASARIATSDAGAILRSPWMPAADERNPRSLADFELRRSRELDVTLRDLIYRAKDCPQLQNVLHRVRGIVRDKPARADFAFWNTFFNDVLAALGWPGDNVTPEEQELVDTWEERLAALSSLSAVSRPVTYEDALRRLESLLDDPGPATGDYFSPIQILDTGQAAGLRFDQAFIAGVSEENSFFRSMTSPLIPLRLQRSLNVPGASAASAHEYRRRALADLFSTAWNIYASYSKRILPAAQEFLSPEVDVVSQWQGRTARQSYVPSDLERLEDSKAPPYTPGDRSLGGAGLLKDQSQCPFRAFAIRRLNARSPEDGSFGLDSRDRGGFVHEALKNLWSELRSQENLKNCPPLSLRSLVCEAVTRAVPSNDKNGPLREQLSLAEIDRLVEVILDWLEIERARKQSFDVELTEQERLLHVAGLHLTIRIDRIDRLSNGNYLLIDYKSGDTTIANLDGNRPREPQLLVYAAAMGHRIDGMFFGQLKPRNARLAGYSRENQTSDRKSQIRPRWDAYLSERIETVEHLAASFVAGEARVDPLPNACKFCAVKPLCRVNETSCGPSEGDLDG